ncbi:MAG: efflux RND transporter permease subunit [Planctomycetes bacterium]|nr:efflux RND transporter permease subunit [Planctomycetota bacterium]
MTLRPDPAARVTSIFRLATDRPVAVSMCVVAVLVFGVLSARKLPIDLMPEINYPTVTVRTEYAGAAPAEVEDRVTRRIEGALAVLSNLVAIRSASRAGRSDVILEFNWKTPMKWITQDIREKLDRTVLPREVDPPTILRYDPSQEPVMRIALTSDRLDLVALRELAEREVEWRLEQVDGVADVKIRGGLEKEIRIAADPDLLGRYGLTTEGIAARLAEENINLASGLLKEGDTEYLVRSLNEFRSVEEIRALTLTYQNGVAVPLSEVAAIAVTHKERDIITRLDGRESVELLLFKEAGANTVGVAAEVRRRLFGTEAQHAALARRDREDAQRREQLARGETPPRDRGGRGARREPHGPGGGRPGDETDAGAAVDYVLRYVPAGTHAAVLSDQSLFITASIREVVLAAIYGGLLAAALLYLFLRRLQPTLIVVAAIPISVGVTFAPMFLGGITLNIMSLGGLAMGIGMLVDNSIVVTESIFRCRQEGDDVRTAALRGVREVGGAVTASTLTTVAVFLPIVFVKGVAGQVFRDHALTVVFSLLASLVVALFVVPMLAARGARRGARPGGRQHLGALLSAPLALRNLTGTLRLFGRRPLPLAVARLAVHALLLPVQLALEVVGRVLAALAILAAVVLLAAAWLAGQAAGPPVRFLLVTPFQAAYGAIERLYPPLLRLALRARLLVVLACVALVVLAVELVPHLGIDLIPEAHQGEFTIRAALPLGTPVERTDRILAPLGDAVLALEEVASVALASGVARDEIADSDEGEHTARALVRLARDRGDAATAAAVRARIRTLAAGNPELSGAPQFVSPSLFVTHTPVEVILKGHHLAELQRAASRVEAWLAGPEFPELRDVRTSIRTGNPEVLIVFDRRKLVDLGLGLETAARRIRTALQGSVATRFNDRDRKVDLLVRLDERIQGSLQALRGMVINPEDPYPRPLEDVAEVRLDTGPAEILRVDQQRAAVVRGNVEGIDLGRLSARIEAGLRRLEAEERGIVTEVGGQNAERKAATKSLALALLLALFLVYVVMASQFENLLHPFVILLTFPLATVGAVPALYLLELRLSVVVGIGAIMLSGIVVNDAIVLVDYVNQLRRRGLERRAALLEAGRVRLRPILMTTLTTMLGLLPLTGLLPWLPGFGTGEGVELRAPMAVTVIAGLASATVLTLVVIPVVYDLLDVRGRRAAPGEPA